MGGRVVLCGTRLRIDRWRAVGLETLANQLGRHSNPVPWYTAQCSVEILNRDGGYRH